VDLAIEAFGGYLGGKTGGCLLDQLEPATSPNHRRIAHSYVVGGLVIMTSEVLNDVVAAGLRAESWRLEGIMNDPRATPVQAFFALILSGLCRIAAGYVNGLPAGWISHLALDYQTPASLPLLFGPARPPLGAW
jgi:hypothetical protein